MKTKLLFIIIATISFTGLKAQTFTDNGIKYNITDASAKTVEVIANSYGGGITIPANVGYNSETYSVTAIGDNAFHDCIYLSSLTLSEGLLQIGSSAIYGCSQLTSLSIPSTVIGIASDALTYTANHLTSLTVVAGNTAYKAIDNVLFTYNRTTLLAYANNSVTNYTVPSGVTAIADNAFVASDIVSVTLPSGVKSIGDNAFSRCYNLSTINFPTSLQSIGSSAFEFCALTSAVLPDGITNIGAFAFYYCNKITDLHIPSSLTEINDYTFSYCSLLTSIVIPEGVTKIGGDAFSFIDALTSVTIPSTVDSIAQYAFSDNPLLATVTCNAINPPVLGDETFGNDMVFGGNQGTMTLIIPQGSEAAYQATGVWKDFQNMTGSTTDISTETMPAKTFVYPNKDGVVIELPLQAEVAVYSVNGTQVYQSTLLAGSHSINLPQGIYVVNVNGASKKVAVK